MLILTCLLAFYLAWNLGANDVANSMGTSVGSKAVTLRQALIIAGCLELTGAVLFGRGVSQTLATGIVDPALFTETPQLFLAGMLSVLLTAGLWLNVATFLGLPVSSSHAVVGAIAGFGWVAAGVSAIRWQSIGIISLSWVVTPIVSGLITAGFYSLVRHWILQHPQPLQQLREWIPWLSTALFTAFGVIVLPTVTHPLQTWVAYQWQVQLPQQDYCLAVGAISAVILALVSWQQLEQHSTAEPIESVERQLGQFQLLSACFVAFAHGSNDVGNAVAPLAAIAYVNRTQTVPLSGFAVPLWVLGLGGVGIVAGLAVWGKKVITTIGGEITPLRPSGGFCAELATATTILLASRLGLPVSTSHALVGGVVALGLLQSREQLQLQVVRQIALVWVVTIPLSILLSAIIFTGLRLVWF